MYSTIATTEDSLADLLVFVLEELLDAIVRSNYEPLVLKGGLTTLELAEGFVLIHPDLDVVRKAV